MNRDYSSDEMVNAFVDGELAHQERLELLNAAASSDELRQKICDAQHLKELVSEAYPVQVNSKVPRTQRRFIAVAASFTIVVMLLVVGFQNLIQTRPQQLTQLQQSDNAQTRVVFHISSNDVDLAQQMMEQVELVLTEYEGSGRNIRVEVVANNQGIRLFQQGVTPIQQQLARLHDRYSNVVFAACANTMERFEKLNGENIKIVPQAVIIRSGVSFVARRQQLGWAYIKV